MSISTTADAVIVGGGLVGVAIAYGLVQRGLDVVILDEGDVAFRASRGNFGLVWVQSKGVGMPAYAQWTRRSSDLWPEFAETVREDTGIDLQFSRNGGYQFCLSEKEFQDRVRMMDTLVEASGGTFTYEMMRRGELADRLPELGPDVVGASFSPHDGHVNSLRLFRAMHVGFQKHGGTYTPNSRVTDITRDGDGFRIATEKGDIYRSARVVLAAGNATRELAPMVGLEAPVSPQKGQILVTAKTSPFLDCPTAQLRQTGEGSVLIGDSKEESGFEDMTSPETIKMLADRAVATFPALQKVRVVRSWAALRVMTPDGFPVYGQSETHPGAFVACLHSGVTLAAAHVGPMADAIAGGGLPPSFESFSADRFNV
ncbi:FAD-dependent oxidoreductase [Fodinicurvata sp. EGI_FJ10296]|uniref:NAD(P)/FAD-dependent oxidoreductase n=1 Tax=Fodinicurvata sp. EGI_FJ10296 TaxID=3231908 RepID=UPI003452C29F